MLLSFQTLLYITWKFRFSKALLIYKLTYLLVKFLKVGCEWHEWAERTGLLWTCTCRSREEDSGKALAQTGLWDFDLSSLWKSPFFWGIFSFELFCFFVSVIFTIYRLSCNPTSYSILYHIIFSDLFTNP